MDRKSNDCLYWSSVVRVRGWVVKVSINGHHRLQFNSNKERSNYRQIQEGKRFIIPFIVEVETNQTL